MTSAERLARSQSSYWRELTPRMESFVRAMNLGVERFSPPIPAEVAPERRAFVAELGFALFRQQAQVRSRDWQKAAESVRSLIARLSSEPAGSIEDPTAIELEQADRIADRLGGFVIDRGGVTRLTVDPEIPGCGIIDHAAADLMIHRRPGRFGRKRAEEEQHLFEVKSVERPFRAEDIRQVLTYAALLSAAGKTPARVGLVNPRLGTFAEWTPDQLAHDVAGVSGSALLQKIVFDVSESETSR